MSIYIIHEVNAIGELAGILYVTGNLQSAMKVFDEIIAVKDETMRRKITSGDGLYLPDDPYFEIYDESDLINVSERKKQGKNILKFAQSYDYDLILEEFENDILYLSLSDKLCYEDE